MFKNLNTKKNFNKKVFILLKKIYGITIEKSLYLCSFVGLTKNTLLKHLTTLQIEMLDQLVTKTFLGEREIKNKQFFNIQKVIDNNSYRGRCHLYGYPCRGQRTHSNGRTQKINNLQKNKNYLK